MTATNKHKFVTIILVIALIIAIIVSAIFAIAIGQVAIPFSDVATVIWHKIIGNNASEYNMIEDIIWQVRMPRVILAIVVGAGLALCGAIMQAIVKNPMADPYILGVSSGASLGATFAIMLGASFTGVIGNMGVSFSAFFGALLATICVLFVASYKSQISSVKLVLSGMVINALFTALSNLVIYFAKDAEGIRSVTFWTMGSLSSASWQNIFYVTLIITIMSIFFLTQWRVLNAMLLGDAAAITLGINLTLYRIMYMVFVAIMTGVMVASCGIIGFVGLIIPHIVRSFIGANHQHLIPITILIGALFLLWTDLLARIVITNSELPIGIVTAIIGAPIFMYMLVKKSYGFGGQ